MTQCCICKGPLATREALARGWTLGNDAQPVAEGRCCNRCKDEVVVPARAAKIREAGMN